MVKQLGMIIGAFLVLLNFGDDSIYIDIGFWILGLSFFFYWVDKNPEHASWWGGESILPWAQDMSDADRKISEISAQRKVDEWKTKRPR